MAGVRVLLVLFLAVIPAYATDYTVGDSQGWSTGVDYTTWVKDKTFKVNDNLVFQYGSLHSVDEVGLSDYNSCSTSNSINSYTGGNNKIALTTAGTHYFICGTPGHCGQGMKVAVTVAGSSPGTPTTPSTPSTPSTPGSPSTPSSPTTPTPSNNKSGAAGNGFHGAMLVGSLLLGLGLMG